MSSFRQNVRTLPTARIRRSPPPLHRIGLAAMLVLSHAPGWSLPTGGATVSGQVSVATQGPNQTIRQGSDKAIIDWQSFSIGAGERVNVLQPSAQATLLNRVIGYDPSRILGQLQSNGRVFLVNPYGIVFGAGARIDVGGLVASTLDLSNADFLAGRISLTANAQTGASIVNEGTIVAPGGVVVMVAPQVANSGTIQADGGRIGLAAANNALVDLDGDGLVFLSVDGDQATNRLNQLGRLQADAGRIELRAAARAAMTDSVLNLEGVVQARSMGLRNGRIVIDGGDSGITNVNGTVDATGLGAGERGGSVDATGMRLKLDAGARIDTTGDQGGGRVRAGGGWQGGDADIRNAREVLVRRDAVIRADAVTMGDGGQVSLWADENMTYRGTIQSRGGAQGGDGGNAEVSGKLNLDFAGAVDLGASKGRQGVLLLDPTTITVDDAGVDAYADVNAFVGAQAKSVTPATLQAVVGTVELKASVDIIFASNLTLNAAKNTGLTAEAGQNITINSGVTLNGSNLPVTLSANDGDSGNANNNGAVTINGTITNVSALTITSNGSGTSNLIANDLSATTINITGATNIGGGAGTRTLTGSVTFSDAANSQTAGQTGLKIAGDVTLKGSLGTTRELASVEVTGTTTLSGGNRTIDAGTGTITLTGAIVGGGNNLTLNATGVTTLSGGGSGLGNLTTNAGGGTSLSGTYTASGDVTFNDNVTLAGPTIVSAGPGGGDDLTFSGSVSLGAFNLEARVKDFANLTLSGTGNTNTTGTFFVAPEADSSIKVSGGSSGTFEVTAANLTTIAASGFTRIGVGRADGTGAIKIDALALPTDTLTFQSGSGNITFEDNVTGTGRGLAASTTGTIATFGDLGAVNKLSSVNLSGGTLTLSGSISTTGDVTLAATNNSLATAGAIDAAGAVALTGKTGIAIGHAVTAGTTLSLATTNSAVNQTAGTISATGATTVVAGTGDVTLNQATNQFSSVAVTSGKDVALKDADGILLGASTATGTLTVESVAGTVTVSGAASGTDVALTGKTGVTLSANVTASGALGLTTTNSAVNQTAGTISATGATTVAAGTGDVTLAQATNDFSSITVTGGAVSLRDTNALTVTALTSGANQAVSIVAGGALTLPASAIDTGTANLTLSSGDVLTSPGALSGKNIALTGTAGITLSDDVTASGTLDLTTTNSAVNQTAGTISATGATTVVAGTGDVTLNQATNQFSSVAVTSGKDVALKDADGILLGASTATGTLTVESVAGTVTVSGAASGTDVALTGKTGVTLSANVTASGALGLTTTNSAVNQTAGTIKATGATTVAAGTGDVTLAQATNDFSSITVTGGAVSLRDTNALTVTALTSGANQAVSIVAGGALTLPASAIDTGTANLTLSSGDVLTSPGALSGKNIALTGTAGITLSDDVTASGTLDLTTTNSAVNQTAGTISATGATTVVAGTGDVTLNQATNQFSSVAVTSGKDVALKDADGILLGASTATGTLTVESVAGTVTVSGAASGTDVALTGKTGVTLSANVTASGALGLTTTNSAVNQTAGTISATGATTVAAGTGDVTLAQATNDFSSITVTGGAVSLRDTNALTVTALTSGANQAVSIVAGGALTLPASAIDTGTANLTLSSGDVLTSPGALSGKNIALTGATGLNLAHDVTASGTLDLTTTNSAVNQTAGTISATGATTVVAGTGDVTLNQATNQFSSVAVTSGKDVALKDADGILLGASTATGTLTVESVAGTVTVSGAASGTDVALTGKTGVTLSANVTASGALGLTTTNSAVNQTAGTISATGATTVVAGTGDVTLNQATNQFSSVAVTSGKDVALKDADGILLGASTATGTLTVESVAGTVTVSGAASGTDVALTGKTGVTLSANVTASGALGLTTTNSAVNQTAGTIKATGATTVAAGTGDVTLAQATNDFSSITVTGGAVSLRDTNALTVTALTSGANQAVSIVAGGALTLPASAIDTGTANLTLSSGDVLTSPGALSGKNIALTGTAGITLSDDVTASGTLDLTTTNSAVNQTAGTISATGATTVVAGTGDVTLNQATNQFSSVAVTSGKDVALKDADGILLGASTATGTLTVESVAGTVTVSGAASGTDVALTGKTGVTLSANVTASGALGLTTTNSAVNQTAGTIKATGATTVAAGTGDVTLAQATNDFSSITVTGGAVSLRDTNALTVTALTSGANQAVSIVAGGALTLPASAIDTGTANLTLSSGDVLTSPGALSGKNIALTGTAGITLSDDVTASGTLDLTTTNSAVNQTAGTISATGATTVVAGTGDVTLNQATNQFSSVAVTSGKDVALKDADGILLGASTATGTLTVESVAGTVTVSGAASGTDVALTGKTGVTLSANVTASGALGLTTTNSAVNQTAGTISATGATTVAAGTGDVTLAQATNDFSSITVTGGAVSLRDTNALTVTALTSGANQAVSIVAGGALTLPASAIDTGTANLTLSSGDVLTSPGALSGKNIALTGATGLNLAHDVTASGTLDLTTTNSAVNQTAGTISATGATTVVAGTGDVTLAQATNDFSSITVTGGAVSLRDTNALTVTALTSGANRTVSVVAAGALSLPAGGIDTGTADLTLSAGNSLTTGGALAGNNIALTGATGVSIAHDITAGGALTLSSTDSAVNQLAGTIKATGTTTVTAGTGDITLAQATNDFTSIGASGGAISLRDTNALSVTALTNGTDKSVSLVAGGLLSTGALGINTGAAALTLTSGSTYSNGGTLRGTGVSVTAPGGITIGKDIVALGSLDLTASSGTVIQTGGTITAAGATTVTAGGAGTVTLNGVLNDFSSIGASGTSVTLVDANALTLNAISATSLTVSAGGAVAQSAAIQATTEVTILAGSSDVTLTQASNDLTKLTTSGANVSVVNSKALVLGTTSADALTIDTSSANGAISQSGPISVSGATIVNAGTGNVTLGNSLNDFNSFGATGGAITITDANLLALSAINATSLTVTTGSVLTQTAPLVVSGTTTINSGLAIVTLNDAGNDFGTVAVTGGAVTLRDQNALELGASSVGGLIVTTAGALTQSGAISVLGGTSVDTGSSAIVLTNASNDFNTIDAKSTGSSVSLRDANALTVNSLTSGANQSISVIAGGALNMPAGTINTGTGDITLSAGAALTTFGDLIGKNVSITGGAGLTIGNNLTATGALSLSSTNTPINQTAGTLSATGGAIVDAGAGTISLNQATNNFGTLVVTGGQISLRDANDLTITSLTSGANQSISIVAGGNLSLPAGAIDTGTADLTLSAGSAITTGGTIAGNNISLAGSGGLNLGHGITAAGTLALATTNSAITQTAGSIVAAGATTVSAGSANVLLAQSGNDFSSLSLAGGAITVVDTNGLTVTSVTNGANQAVNLKAGASMTLLQNTTLATGTADLTLEATAGLLSISGPLSGAAISLTGATAISLGGLATSITSTGNQTYVGNVVAAASTVLDAGAALIDLQGSYSGGSQALTLNSTNAAANAIRMTGAVSSVSNLTVNGNLTLGNSVTTTGTQTYANPVTLDGNATLTGSSITFDKTIDGSKNLVIDVSSTATLKGNVGMTTPLANLTIKSSAGTGTASIGNDPTPITVKTSLDQTYDVPVSLAGDLTVVGDDIVFNKQLNTKTFVFESQSTTIAFNGGVTGTGTFVLAPNSDQTIGIAGANGSFKVSQAQLDSLKDYTTVIIGRSDTTTQDIVSDSVTLPSNLRIRSTSGNVTFDGTVDSAVGVGNKNLQVTTSGLITFNGAVGATNALGDIAIGSTAQVNGTAMIGTGNQTWSAGATIGANTLVQGASLSFAASLATGANDVRLLGDAITIVGPVSGTGTVQMAPITAATSIGLAGGAGTLSISQATLDAFGTLKQLTIGQSGGTGTITAGALTLSTDTVIQSAFGAVNFTGAVNSANSGANDLTVNTSGLTSFGGSVGATKALDTLSLAGASQFAGGSVVTSAAQSYGGDATFSGATALRGSSVTFSQGLATGAIDLDIQAATMAFNGSVSGSGQLSLAPDAAGGTIGLAGGAGTLQVSQATLDKFTGYASLTIGRTDGTGALNANALVLPTQTTLRSGSGAMTLAGTVNAASAGAQDLTISTTGTTTLGGAVGGTAALRNLSVTGPASINGGAVTSTAAQSYNGTVALGAATTLRGSAVGIGGTLNNGANALAVFADSVTMGALSTGAGTVQLAPASAGGSIGITGAAGTLQLSQALLDAFATSSAITIGRTDGTGAIAANALTLPTDTTVQSASGTVSFTAAVDSANSGANDLTVNTSGLTSFGGSVGATKALDTLSLAGASQFAGGSVVTSAAQSYGGDATFSGATALRGSSVTFSQGLATGAIDLDIQAATMAFNGSVSGSGQLSLAPDAAGGTIGLAGGAGTLQVSQATLDKFTGYASLTIGRTDGTGALNANALVLPTQTTLRSGSGAMTLAGTVNAASAGAQDLTISTTGTTTLGGAVGGTAALRNLSVTGPASINGGAVTSTAAQSYNGTVALGAATTLRGSAVGIGGTLNNGANALAVFADSVTMGALSTGAGTVQLAPASAGGSIGITGAAGTLQLSQALLDAFATSSAITIGRTDGTGAIAANALTLPTDTTVRSASGTVSFTAAVDSANSGAKDLTVTTTGLTTLNGAVGGGLPLDVLSITGASQIGAGSITSVGSQSYGRAVTLTSDLVLGASAVNFGSTIDGAQALTINAAGLTDFGSAVGATTALTSLTTNAGGSTALAGNVSTTGTQTYGDQINLNADAVLSGSAISLGAAVNGARALTLNAADATIAAPVGAGTALTSLTATGKSTLSGGAITTTGTQAFVGAVTLGANTALSASAVTFGSTIDGAQALAITSAGQTAFGGTVGGGTALTSVALTGGGAATLAGTGVTTTGAQSYSGSMTVGGGNATFTASALTFSGNLSGAKDLSLLTDALTAGSIAGSGVLTIAPQDKSISIGLAGGAGTMQISQATIDSAAGFTAHAFGRADGTGTIQANDLNLRANTTLQTDTGDIRLNGKVDGAFDLALNSGGTTRIAGPVGSVTALKSLLTDNNKVAADFDGKAGERTLFDLADGTGRARVITTGAQTFNDPLVASVPMQFIGGAVSAVQAASSFTGDIKATADSLALKSGGAITLSDVTLANGGAIESAGTIDLAGALTLNGGTLVLTSTATPTALAQFTDAELKARSNLAFGTLPVKEASATVFQSGTGVITTAAGSTLALRSPAGGTISLTAAGNKMAGGISAVSGTLNDTKIDRFNLGPEILIGEVRIVSSEIHVAGAPPANNDQTATQAGLEADFMRLSTDQLTTGQGGQIRVRLPYNSAQGTKTSVPGITFEMGAEALKNFGSFGGSNPDQWVQIGIGGTAGGFLTVIPKGQGALPGAQILLGGPPVPVPFYDGTGKPAEVRVFFNGATTQTAQETGALQAVSAVVEESRQSRFEEAVRTENVTGRLRSGVIAEVGAGRPATVGRETIRLPQVCNVRPGQLKCE